MKLVDKTPGELARDMLFIAEEYSRYGGELAKLTQKEAEFFNSRRQDYKSDNATNKAFAVTEDGVRKTQVEIKLKTLQRESTAIKTYIEVLSNEARGTY